MPEDTHNSDRPDEKVRSQQMELILRQLESLPTLPAVATRLLNLTTSDQSQIQEVTALIRADQSLTAKILSMANRADSGIRKEARTVEKVSLMLGFEAIRSAVLSIKVFEAFGPRSQREGGLDRAEFWKHCVAVATAAEMLARRLRLPIDTEEVFVCGLLHDMGKLALEHVLPKSYARAVEAANHHCGNIADFERRIIGLDHTIVGRRLAQQWRLPALIEQTIWLHHQPFEAIPEILPGRKVIALIHLADTLVREQRFGYSGNFVFTEHSKELAERIGVTPGMLQQTVEQLPSQIEIRANVLGLGNMTSESLYREALAAANVELGKLNAKLHQRAIGLDAQARAFSLLRQFGARLSSTMSLSGLCQLLAETWAKAGNLEPSSSKPVIAYVLAGNEPVLVAALAAGGGASEVAVLPRRADFPPGELPAAVSPADRVLPHLLADMDRWLNWAGSANLSHRILTCSGRWTGGLLYPAEANEAYACETSESIAMSMSFAAAALAARDSANLLAEQLGQSSQKLYDAQRELTETRALAAVGEMAAGAAHEINNPLAVVVGRAQLMADSAGAADRQTWRTIADQAQRISDIVSEMMEFARPSSPKSEPVAVNDLISSAREQLAEVPVAQRMAVEISVPSDLPAVMADRRQMSWVLAELMTNAAEANPERPHVRVEAEADEITAAVLVRVIDRGPGMDAETVDKAFAPFFSAKPAGRKRGMGLSKARRLVQQAGGKIWIQSAPGRGATVFVLLPRAEESVRSSSGESNE